MPGATAINADWIIVDDNDLDGMPNSYEKTNNFDPDNAADASADTDSDGQSNVSEYLAGTDPRNRNSVLRVKSIARSGSNWSLASMRLRGSCIDSVQDFVVGCELADAERSQSEYQRPCPNDRLLPCRKPATLPHSRGAPVSCDAVAASLCRGGRLPRLRFAPARQAITSCSRSSKERSNRGYTLLNTLNSKLKASMDKPLASTVALLTVHESRSHVPENARVVEWQTRTFEGRMPKGMRVQVPPRAFLKAGRPQTNGSTG